MPNIDMNRELAYQPGERSHGCNVLLIVVDDLRAGNLGAWGYERDTTPLLDRRIAGRAASDDAGSGGSAENRAPATAFMNCHSPVGWTLPACASIITGQLPDQHGLYDHNQKFRKPKIGHYLGDSYDRYAITNNGNVVTDNISAEYLEKLGLKRRPAKWRFFNWDDGFDRYRWVAREDHELPYELATEFLESKKLAAESKKPGANEEPWFFFFHSNLVHDYHMDREYYLDVEEWLGGEVHPELLSVRDGPDIWQRPPDGLDLDTVREHMLAKYDSGIRGMDRRIDDLLNLVDFESTIVVFMSDHGEGFDPGHGRVHHCGRLHNDLSHVPLALWLPTALREKYPMPERVTRRCSTIDVVPSILTLLGDAVAGFPGQLLFDLSAHRQLKGCDRGYIYWNDDFIRESYDTARVEIRSECSYPLKDISVKKNDSEKRYSYNLAYDPHEHENLVEPALSAIDNFEPISFIVAVNDEDELKHNLLSSPVAQSPHHEWLLVRNPDNSKYSSVSELYADAAEEAEHDLLFFVHQDVFLPEGWERRTFAALAELESDDPDWGVIGAVGALNPDPDREKQLRGHWCDPSGHHQRGPLPHVVQSLDELWLGVRRGSGVRFDPDLPGFHCYGIDLCLAALDLGLKSYAIDSFAWHKFKDPSGYLVSCREDSQKIQERWTEAFMRDFQPCADYVEQKWKKYLPFQTTSWNWDAS